MENDYIISEGFLNYPCVNESVNGYKLYSINKNHMILKAMLYLDISSSKDLQ